MSFFQRFQPSIIKLSSDDCIPSYLRNKYMININCVGIKWFEENFILLEDENGAFLLQEKDSSDKSFKILLENYGSDRFDIPRLYIVIDDNIVKDDDNIYKIVYDGLTNNEVYGEGFNGFRPGINYYVNKTLYTWLTSKVDTEGNTIDPIIEDNLDIVLPNYLDSDGSISHHFEELSESDKDYTKLSYYLKKNEILGYSFTENELRDFTSTFCGIILDNSEVQNETDTQNQVYKLVLEYWRNHQSDCASIALALILGTKYTTSTITTTCNSCFNTSSTSTDTSIDKSCYEKYQDAMKEWLKYMLGDNEFYEDWFYLLIGDCLTPNTDMIDLLIDLINSLLNTGWNLGTDTSNKKLSCNCPDLDNSYDDTCNRNILLNYIKVLEWVKADNIISNKNKIKIYGQQFGELLTKLSL